MSVNLSKGEKISLEKSNGNSLNEFCVGANWGSIEAKGGFLGFGKKIIDVDLDLSCILLDSNKKMVDYIYSPLYRIEVLSQFDLQKGKLQTFDNALRHSGDDRAGDSGGDDGMDNEIITVDLKRLNTNVSEIYFFLNNVGKEDFSQIPYTKLRMYEGTPTVVKNVFADYNVSSDMKFRNNKAIIMGKLKKTGSNWEFIAIGEPTEDVFLGQTIVRILTKY